MTIQQCYTMKTINGVYTVEVLINGNSNCYNNRDTAVVVPKCIPSRNILGS